MGADKPAQIVLPYRVTFQAILVPRSLAQPTVEKSIYISSLYT
jgi:hypothetical protein